MLYKFICNWSARIVEGLGRGGDKLFSHYPSFTLVECLFQPPKKDLCICGVRLPNSEDFQGR